ELHRMVTADPCKQQGIYRAPCLDWPPCRDAVRRSSKQKSRPRRPMGLLSCATLARDMSFSCKRPALGAPGAIPTVDFLLYLPGAVVKKMAVKSNVRIPPRIIWRGRSRCRAPL